MYGTFVRMTQYPTQRNHFYRWVNHIPACMNVHYINLHTCVIIHRGTFCLCTQKVLTILFFFFFSFYPFQGTIIPSASKPLDLDGAGHGRKGLFGVMRARRLVDSPGSPLICHYQSPSPAQGQRTGKERGRFQTDDCWT
jgi:hypothetical protein